MDYISITPDQRTRMLESIGVKDVDEIFSTIPESVRLENELDLPPAKSELELQRRLEELAGANRGASSMACFMGGGAYDHFIPAFIDQLVSRGEFLTSYTPYQAEASQGSLQAFFEFQSQVARLTGLDIANASLYEGASAAAEAITMAVNVTGKRRVLIAETVHPDTRAVLRTHLEDLPVEPVTLPRSERGVIDPSVVKEHADTDTACIVVQSPNVYGLLENWSELFEATQAANETGKRPLNIAVFNPIACALLKRPGECGADVAAGEGQPLGVPLQLGGPYLGLFAARKEHLRRMPGRLVGQTTDASGRRAYALILQTREQHIRGAKATSNICTNQGLLAMRATMYMTAMGRQGLRQVAEQCWHKAHHLANQIDELKGCAIKYAGDFFNEFVVTCPKPAREIIEAGRQRGVLAGVDLSSDRLSKIGAENELLVAVTEKRTRSEMDAFIETLRDAAA